MAYEGPERWRDEDHWPEIGSEAWFRAEIAAGRQGEEIDRYGGDARNPGTRQVRATPALDREAAQPLIPAERASASFNAPLLTIVIWAAIFVLYALHVYV